MNHGRARIFGTAQRFKYKGIHERPGQISVAGFLAPATHVRQTPARRGPVFDGHEGLHQIDGPRIPLKAAFSLDRKSVV